MPDVTDCLLLPYPLLTDTPDVPRDIQALAERVDDLLCGANVDIDELKTQMNLRVRKAGDTMTGTLVANASGAGIRVARPGNAPFIEWTAHPGPTPRFGYIQAQSDRFRYDVESSTGFHHFVIGNAEVMRISAGGIVDANQFRSAVRMTAGAPTGPQLVLVDTQPVANSPSNWLAFYEGTVSSLGPRRGYIGWPNSMFFRIANELANSNIQLMTAAGGDIYVTPGSGGIFYFGANANTKGALVDNAFLFGKTASDLSVQGTEILCGGSAEGAVRSTVALANIANFYARRQSAAMADDQWFLQCTNGSTTIGGIRANGTGAVELVGTATSDYRVKEVLGPITDAASRLRKLRPLRYVRTDDDTGDILDGFLAHEVAEVVPEAVSGAKDGMEADGVTMRLQEMHGEKLVPLLVATVLELLDEVASLRERVG